MRRRLLIALAFVAVVGGGLAAGSLLVDGGDDEQRLPVARKKPGAATPTPTATPAGALPRAPVSERVRALAARMPVERQVAQVMLVGFEGTDLTAPILAEVARRPWGAVLATAEQLTVAAEVPVAARAAQRVPPLVVAEPLEEGELTGVDLVLGPAADVELGEEPPDTAERVRFHVGELRRRGLLSAPGHFPGQGAATQDPLEGPAAVGLPRDQLQLAPFRAAIAARVPAIVVSSAAFTAFDPITPATMVPAIVRDLLRRELGFRGLAIAADLAGAAAATGGTMGAAGIEALKAGIDLLQVADPEERAAAYDEILRAARSRRIPPARLREAVEQVLALKERANLL